ncbi:OB-fold-containig protein [Microvirga sp. 2MCAF38]|uniref:OB-fold-containig protein n=1 Tax=Microvirga sp. 2MCAF38 TaxID=3232989 RepID=UPI003F9A06C9
MELLISPSYQPFTVAGLVMVGLVVIETISLVVGFSLSAMLDSSLDFDLHGGQHANVPENGVLGGVLGWVNAGRVPVLVFLITWLAAFAVAGLMIQAVAATIWAPLPVLIAAPIAFFLAAPGTRVTTRLVAFIIPRDETYVVSNDDLVGRIAEVILGPLDQGLAGRIKLQDAHGNWHFLMARAAKDHGPMQVGAQVLLVDRNGSTFLAIPAPEQLTPTH